MIIKREFNPDFVFFTSDLHFCHSKIIEYCNRPFSSVEEMDETIITRWNSKVPYHGTTFIGGDFIFTGNLEIISDYLSRLNGEKILILGNHDYRNKMYRKSVVDLFDGHVYDSVEFTVKDPRLNRGEVNFYINHYPCEFWPANTVHLHGHVHGGPRTNCSEVTVRKPKRYDIGVDNNEFYPASYYDLITILDLK